MTTIQIQELARFGAEARLRAINEERRALLQAFPDLRNGARLSERASWTGPSSRKPSGMSPAQGKAVGERMKAYWAKRRAEKAVTAAPQGETASETPATVRRKGGMSAEARKAQGRRMRAYWAKRRAEKAGAGEGAQGNAASNGSALKSGRKAGRKQGRKK
jgi:hypothetical protein